MFKKNSKQPWYGELRSRTGTSIMIYDNKLPCPPSGRILLYNADRDRFIEYVEEIVTSKLFELEGDALAEAKKKLKKPWQKAKDIYLREHQSRLVPVSAPKKEARAAVDGSDDSIGNVDDGDMDDFSLDFAD